VRILSVVAPGNGSGKTLTLSAILGAFPGRLSAVKFTTVFKDGVNCPRTAKACACHELKGLYTVVTDPATLAMQDTDTGRLAGAGARAVLWCLARPGAQAAAWDHLRREHLSERDDLLTEGNTMVPVLDPDLLIMVMSAQVERARWKADAWPLARSANLVIINRHDSSESEIAALADEVTRQRGGRAPLVEDVGRPLASWSSPALHDAVAAVLAAPDRRRAGTAS
jgi:hypothetical protein